MQVRVPAPNQNEIGLILKYIAQKEGFNLPAPLVASITNLSRRNLRRAIMMLQTIKLKHENLTEKTFVSRPEYETYTIEIAKEVISEQSPK